MGGRNGYIRSERVRPSLEERIVSTLRSSSLTAGQISQRIGRNLNSVIAALNALEAKGLVVMIKECGARRWKINKEPAQ